MLLSARPFAVVVALALVPSCVADVSEEMAQTSEASAVKPGARSPFTPPELGGPCATACSRAMSGQCGNWQDECADDYPDDQNVNCGVRVLTCGEAQDATSGRFDGLMECYRSCERLNRR